MSDCPLVSIGLPVYNGASRIRRVLEGLTTSAYTNLEIVISDNASTDATPEICREFASRDKRIRYFRNETNLGQDRNGTLVFELSTGKYFLAASHHDERDATYISKCVEIMERDEKVVLCYSKALWLEEGDRIAGVVPRGFDTRGMALPYRFVRTMWSIGYCYQLYGLLRKTAVAKCLILRPKLAPDHLLLAELSLCGEFAYIPEPLFRVWRDDDSRSIHKYFVRRGMRLEPRLALQAIKELVSFHIKTVAFHVSNPVMKAILDTSVIICMLFKYPRLFFGVLFSSFRST